MSTVTLHEGDMREVLARLAKEGVQVDSCVTDPPYFLTSVVDRFSSPTAAAAKQGADGRFARLSGGFMGRKWDAPGEVEIDPGFAYWMAGFIDGEGCFHVHRKKVNDCETYDCQFSITLRADDADIVAEMRRQLGGIGTIATRKPKHENAGPQVRYCISSKADCLRLREVLRAFPLRAKKARDFEVWSLALDEWLAHQPGGSWEEMAYFRDYLMVLRRYGSHFNPMQLAYYRWARSIFSVLKPGAHFVCFGGTRTFHRLVAAVEDAGFEIRDGLMWIYGSGFPKSHDVSKGLRKMGQDELAESWKGWGTALKPAYEPICFARKPLDGTVAANVLKHGAGALNIDGCRIESSEDLNGGAYAEQGGRGVSNWLHAGSGMNQAGKTVGREFSQPKGRWPANVVHDGSDEVVRAFPGAPGQLARTSTSTGTRAGQNVYGAMAKGSSGREPRGDAGSAARFFYSSKADAEDRLGSKHPTVKPVDLMRWLVRLVTPPGGTVLDPFAGSGTTGMACMAEGFDCILVEREAEYVADIRRRIAHVRGEDAPLFARETA